MVIISVVRDYEMYNRLIKNNVHNKSAIFVDYDNTTENKSIPERYNSFIDSYDYSKEDWFVFCHEDWEIKEKWERRFKYLDKNSLYGPIGVILYSFGKFLKLHKIGTIWNSNRENTDGSITGQYASTGTEVSTFDCQCLIVHSDLIKKYNLRFDENLHWDLYVEDFCANAREKYDIKSRIMNLHCQHYSFGNIQQRFYDNFHYLKNKYKGAKYAYSSTVTVINDIFGCQKVKNNFWGYLFYKFMGFVFTKKIKTNGRIIIKVLKIQLPQFIAKFLHHISLRLRDVLNHREPSE